MGDSSQCSMARHKLKASNCTESTDKTAFVPRWYHHLCRKPNGIETRSTINKHVSQTCEMTTTQVSTTFLYPRNNPLRG